MKPLGVFSSSPDRPPWASFALLADWADMADAAQQSRETGIRWVLYLGGIAHDVPVELHARAVYARCEAAGLLPHLVGICYHEEWYSSLKGGLFSHLPALQGVDLSVPDDLLAAVRMVCGWVGAQHAVIRRVFLGVPIVLIESYVNDDASFGAGYYQPVPFGVNVLALEGYVHGRGTWAADVEPFLWHAVRTRTEPIALIVQGFQIDGDPLWARGPTADGIANTARWMRHPRVIAGWLFDWGSRPTAKIRGLADLPECAAIEAAMGVPA